MKVWLISRVLVAVLLSLVFCGVAAQGKTPLAKAAQKEKVPRPVPELTELTVRLGKVPKPLLEAIFTVIEKRREKPISDCKVIPQRRFSENLVQVMAKGWDGSVQGGYVCTTESIVRNKTVKTVKWPYFPVKRLPPPMTTFGSSGIDWAIFIEAGEPPVKDYTKEMFVAELKEGKVFYATTENGDEDERKPTRSHWIIKW